MTTAATKGAKSLRVMLGGAVGMLGVALAVSAFLALTGPGRIDVIDGQFRFDVALHLLTGGGPIIQDPALVDFSPVGVSGKHHAFYAPGSSWLGVPLLMMARLFGDDPRLLMFFFSFGSAVGAGVAVAAYVALLRQLGVARHQALGCAGLLVIASPLWFMGTTLFHQAQYVGFLTSGLAVSCWAARRGSAAGALLGGVIAGLSVYVQESTVLLVPWVAAPLLLRAELPRRRRWTLVALCGLGTLLGAALLLHANHARFGSVWDTGKGAVTFHPPVWGSGWFGALALTFSPGKSWLLFAPIYVASGFGLRAMWSRSRGTCVAMLGMLATQYALVSNLSFFGGDWAWGPRYLMGLAPIALLSLPFGLRVMRLRRLAWGLVGISACVQLLSVSVDHQRFFVERSLPPFFWYDDPAFYYRDSQLFARLDEVTHLRWRSYDDELRRFRPGPYPGLSTYAIFGKASPVLARHAVFQLPRPWPLWVPRVPERLRPVDPGRAAAGLGALMLLGGLMVAAGPAIARRAQGAAPQPVPPGSAEPRGA